jgi:hypothetical protein
MQWSPKKNQPLWPQALPMTLNLRPNQPYQLTNPSLISSKPSLVSRMTLPTSSGSPLNKAPKFRSKRHESRNLEPHASSCGRLSSTIGSASGLYTTISFPSRKGKSQKDKGESPSDKPIDRSNPKRTLFERMTVADLKRSQQMMISESGNSSPDPNTLPVPQEEEPLPQQPQPLPLLQQLQPPPLLQQLQSLPLQSQN